MNNLSLSILLYPFVPRAMDVERGDIVILMINLYPMNKGIHFVNSYLLGSDLSVAISIMHCSNWVLGGKVSHIKLATVWS